MHPWNPSPVKICISSTPKCSLCPFPATQLGGHQCSILISVTIAALLLQSSLHESLLSDCIVWHNLLFQNSFMWLCVAVVYFLLLNNISLCDYTHLIYPFTFDGYGKRKFRRLKEKKNHVRSELMLHSTDICWVSALCEEWTVGNDRPCPHAQGWDSGPRHTLWTSSNLMTKVILGCNKYYEGSTVVENKSKPTFLEQIFFPLKIAIKIINLIKIICIHLWLSALKNAH